MHNETKQTFFFFPPCFFYFFLLESFVKAIKEHEKKAITAVGFLMKYRELQQIRRVLTKSDWIQANYKINIGYIGQQMEFVLWFWGNALYYNIPKVLCDLCKLMTQTCKIELIGIATRPRMQGPTGKKSKL